MSSSNAPLIPTPARRSGLPAKAICLGLILSLASLATLIAIHKPSIRHSTPLRPSDLCRLSASPAACGAIVSDAIAAGGSSIRPNPVQVLQAIISRSLIQLDTVLADRIHPRANHNLDPKSALADCVALLDLSRDRLLDSASAIASGNYADARTWLSAALTNHDTCLDGGLAVPSGLGSLVALASASLAVLNAISAPNSRDVLVKNFPSWAAVKDRKLLEASTANPIEANATVAADGSGDYGTVQEALDNAPSKGKSRYVIHVKNGTYEENVMVWKNKTNLMIVGDGSDSTVITGDRNVVDGWTTFNSATLAAVADGFILQDICIQNTAGPEKHQAVALRVGADKSVINRCRLDGYQDTLYAHSLRQFYRETSISGTVDFIFGNAAVVFQKCHLVARLPMRNQQNLVTAQGRTDPNQNTGTSIQNCQVVPGPDLLQAEASIPTYLGRPWKNFSRTVYMQSYIDGHVDPKGWLEWDGDFALDTLYYGEFANVGPGAGIAGRVNWTGYNVITDPNVANDFTVAQFIQGGQWLQSTGVEYTEGL